MKKEKEATNADDLAIQDPLNVAKEKSQGPLAIFINNPGLQHLAKEIFWNLSFEALENCQQLNQSSVRIMEDPFFWLEIIKDRLSEESKAYWTTAIQAMKNSTMERLLALYLKQRLKKIHDFPRQFRNRWINPMLFQSFRCKIREICKNPHPAVPTKKCII